MHKEFIYADARIHAKETSLLNKQNIESLLFANDVQACIRLLEDKGWGDNQTNDPAEFLKAEEKKLWDLMKELTNDLSYFDIFRLQTDYHNIKAAVKTIVLSLDPDDMLLYGGTISFDTIKQYIKEKNPEVLPESFRETASQALKALLELHDGQLCDNIIDKQCLKEIYSSAQKTENDLIKLYADIFTACTNIKIAIRCNNAGQPLHTIENSLADLPVINVKELSESALKGIDGICDYLKDTFLSEGSEALKKSISEFEKWCDNFIIENMKSQKYEHKSVGPLIAYIIAKENEIKTVRLILSAKQNHLDQKIIEERLRNMYV